MNLMKRGPTRPIWFAALVLLGLLACGDGTAPSGVEWGTRWGQLSVVAHSDNPAPIPAPLQPSTLEARVWTADGSEVVKDTSLTVTSGEQVDLTIRVQVEGADQPFLLELVLRNADGAEVFRGGPVTVLARLPGSPASPVSVPLNYTGPGAEATRLEVTPEESRVRVGETLTLQVNAFTQDGASLGAIPVEWATLDPLVVSLADPVTGQWQAQGIRGTARVTASFTPRNLTDTALIRVIPLPGSIDFVSGQGQAGSAGSPLPLPLTVLVTATDGLPLEGEEVAFEAAEQATAEPAVGVTAPNGRASTRWTLGPPLGIQNLVARVVAAPSLAITFTAVAGPAALARLEVTPDQVTLDAIGATQALAVAAFDGFGNPRTLPAVDWTSSDPSVASVTDRGLVTAAGNGTAEITASSEGITSPPATVVVDQIAVSADIAPGSGWELVVDDALTFVATARDRLEGAIDGAAFTWTSSSTNVLSVDSEGRAVGRSVGSATVTATLIGDPSILAASSGAVVPPPPSAPSNVTSTPQFPGEGPFAGFDLSWNDNSNNEELFSVQRSLNNGGTWQTVGTTGANTTTTYDPGPGSWPMDRRVLHRVRACADGRCSSPAVTAQPGFTSPNPPANVAGTWQAVPTTLRVSWSDTNNFETGHEVYLYERTCSGTQFRGSQSVGANVTSVDYTGQTANGDYDMYVYAVNPTEWSNSVFHQIGPGPFCRSE